MKTSAFRFTSLLVLTLLPALVCAQGLASVAAKEKERRKQAAPATPTKVYSENDLQGSGAPAPDPAASSSGAEATPSTPGAAGVINRSPSRASGGDTEATWHDNAARARSRISAAEARVAAVEREANAKASWGAPKRDCNIPDSVVREGREAMKRWSCDLPTTGPDPRIAIDSARQELQRAKDAWTALEDRARRAGIPAGWLR